MDVSVTIANWNRADLLEECLRSVFATPRTIDYEVIVVDNASSDNSVAMMQQRFPQSRLIINSENLGFGKAQNQAAAQAQGRYILVLNNDAAVFTDTIPALVKFMDEHPNAGICTCAGRQRTGSPWLTGGGMRCFPSISREFFSDLLELITPPFALGTTRVIEPLSRWIAGCRSPSAEQEVAWARGALLLVRRSMLDEIGGFDERFFMYFEEPDLCLRARRAGWSVWLTPTTSYIHEAGQSTRLRNDRENIYAASGWHYFRKHEGPLKAVLFRLENCLIRQELLRFRRAVGKAIRPYRSWKDRPLLADRQPWRHARGRSNHV